MSVRLAQRVRFEAAHRLVSEELTDAENEATYGKCCRPGGHGHNYQVWVTVEGEPDPVTGFVVDRETLAKTLEELVVDRVDHRNLNDVLECITTGENLVDTFREWVGPRLGSAEVVQVELIETERNRFQVGGA